MCIRDRGTDIYEDIKEKAPGVYEDIREKSGAAFAKAKDAAKDARERLKKDKTDEELNMEDVELYEKEEEPFGDADDWQDDTQKED